ncbi:hypothetical protein VOLCADRAFT_121332 [Volvox carteri f. nagariensis]|uniref:Uncharacterized protein n=1 Tax=Volvox carteri f. nagariensis TaxID=3068 RepID=D8U7J2_VOLCA|nr:uncharacterized protein VOLCADRAFT_121332 [Volvox carteri f. nagariensis]EFJ44307.1 hypothetical protein VOLCADRAFT_121332 [Volvox carteri f. nagariensis]|eukprot:XP_002954666.1 hypothetical protein VOLCADRAFT_121332 [Volvox carteri f. nagariensis]
MQWLPCSASIHDAAVTTARFGHSAVCISGTGSVWGTDLVVVFGGVSYSDGESHLEHHTALGDVTVLQAEADMWFTPQVSSAPGAVDGGGGDGGLPEPRAFHCAAAVDRRMYVFGGHVMSYDPVLNKKRRRFFNDLWCLDTDTWTWQCLSANTGGTAGGAVGAAAAAAAAGGPAGGDGFPPRRDMATLTRAGPSCLLLFGGRLESGRVAGDAWVLDTHTRTWSQLRIPGPLPAPRKMHAAVYVTNRVVIFGGERDSGLLDDLWTLKGADGSEAAKWTQIKLRPSPSGRFGHGMAACGSRLAVFGGCLDHSSLLSFSRTYVQCNELWVLDMATFSWHRVEAPEGVTPLTGTALEDPHLPTQLQQQLQQLQLQQESGVHAGTHQQHRHQREETAPGAAAPLASFKSHQHQHPPPLLPLPLERMCHSVVAVGPSDVAGLCRLLVVGGRKREGICGDAWWLMMGPDNLTPVLTAPQPEDLAAALTATAAQRAVQQQRAHAAASPPPVPPAASTAAAAATPLLPNPTLLSNLLRKSAPPSAAVAAVAAAVTPPSGDGSTSSLQSSLDAVQTGAAASPPLVPAPTVGSQRVAASTSSGCLSQDPAGTAVGAGIAVQPSGASLMGRQSPQGQNGEVGGRERMADKASQAINRITRQVSTLLRSDAAAAAATMTAPAAAAAATTAAAAATANLSTSPSGGRILARLFDGGTASGAATRDGGGTAMPPPVIHSTLTAKGPPETGGGGVPRSPLPPPAAPPLPPSPTPADVYGSWENLRSALGLIAQTPSGSLVTAPAETASASTATATANSTTRRQAVDAAAALAALGRQLAVEEGPTAVGAGGWSGVGAAASAGNAAGAVRAARRHLVSCPVERLTVGQLELVLADCQALLKSRTTRLWEQLEQQLQKQQQQQQHATTQQQTGPSTFTTTTVSDNGNWNSSSSRSSGGGGGGRSDPAGNVDSTALTCLVASSSHWLVGLSPEELRLGAVGRLVGTYGELLKEAGEGRSGAGGGGGIGLVGV